jgi:hypothetical protein
VRQTLLRAPVESGSEEQRLEAPAREDVRAVLAEALRRAGLDGDRPVGLESVWRDAGLRDAVDRWP